MSRPAPGPGSLQGCRMVAGRRRRPEERESKTFHAAFLIQVSVTFCAGKTIGKDNRFADRAICQPQTPIGRMASSLLTRGHDDLHKRLNH